MRYINEGYVPKITNVVENKVYEYSLGYYEEGFWNQNKEVHFPFLKQSYLGNYFTPTYNQNLISSDNIGL